MEGVRTGRAPFRKLDVLHRQNLDRVLPRFGVETLSEDDRRDLNLAWHRLDAWPDVAGGFRHLKRRYLLAPLSDGNISIIVDLARRDDFPWDAVLGAEFTGDYKPKPRVYLDAARHRSCPTGMHDRGRAQFRSCGRPALGLHTAHTARPDEDGSGRGELSPTVPVDVAAKNLEDLAAQLGA